MSPANPPSKDPRSNSDNPPPAEHHAPGFFSVARSPDGRWNLLTPDLAPFQFRGACGVNRAGTQGGRLAVPGPYAQTIDLKYRYQDSPKAFVDAVLDRHRQWGFNALGCWATDEFFNQGMPFTEFLGFNKVRPPLEAPGIKVPDVFDPAWVEAVDDHAARFCTPLRDSRDLVGYFTDNELGWGQPSAGHIWGAPESVNRKGPTLLQALLGLPEDRPARAAAWQFVIDRYGSLDRLNQAWGLSLDTPEQMQKINELGQILVDPEYGEAQDAFSQLFAGLYVEHTGRAIRRHDPNHLILGARFGGPPGTPVLEAFTRPWVDVVSANNYRVDMFGRMQEYWIGHHRPILIGEFAWASPPFVDPEHWTEEARQSGESVRQHVERIGRQTLEQGLAHPGVIGYTWYRWVQNKKRDIGYGLVHTDDEPDDFNVPLLKQIHETL